MFSCHVMSHDLTASHMTTPPCLQIYPDRDELNTQAEKYATRRAQTPPDARYGGGDRADTPATTSCPPLPSLYLLPSLTSCLSLPPPPPPPPPSLPLSLSLSPPLSPQRKAPDSRPGTESPPPEEKRSKTSTPEVEVGQSSHPPTITSSHLTPSPPSPLHTSHPSDPPHHHLFTHHTPQTLPTITLPPSPFHISHPSDPPHHYTPTITSSHIPPLTPSPPSHSHHHLVTHHTPQTLPPTPPPTRRLRRSSSR